MSESFYAFSGHRDEMNMAYDMKLWVMLYNDILLTRNCSALYKDPSITYGKDYKNFEYDSFQYFIFGYDTTKQTMFFFKIYFVERASRYKFLAITNLTHFFMYLFISCLYMFQASQRSSSGDRIVLIHHLVWLVCVSDCLVCRSGGNCSSLLTGIPSSHLHRLIIPDDVLIQFDLLMMSTVMLETCREMK